LSKLDISLLHALHDTSAATGLIGDTRIMLEKRVGEFGPLKKLTISPCMARKLDIDGTAEAVVLGDCPVFIPKMPDLASILNLPRTRPSLD